MQEYTMVETNTLDTYDSVEANTILQGITHQSWHLVQLDTITKAWFCMWVKSFVTIIMKLL